MNIYCLYGLEHPVLMFSKSTVSMNSEPVVLAPKQYKIYQNNMKKNFKKIKMNSILIKILYLPCIIEMHYLSNISNTDKMRSILC